VEDRDLPVLNLVDAIHQKAVVGVHANWRILFDHRSGGLIIYADHNLS
jgi:hypothetical protein